jgi:SAM-dependent methyltransferase
MSLFFRVAYLVGFKPWDSEVPPPELVALVEGDRALPVGKFLDIGCGTAPCTVYAARHGWDATGVDIVPRALKAARRRVAGSGVAARLIEGDVTRLKTLGVGAGYSLLLDKGCYHAIPGGRRDAYRDEVATAASPSATFLMFAFERSHRPLFPAGIDPGEVDIRFGRDWRVVADVKGEGPGLAPHWFHLERKG